jgi:hypothetical protein
MSLGEAYHRFAYVYFKEGPERRSAAKLLTKDEARRIAVNFATLGAAWLISVCVRLVASQGSI